jgi:predicted alpha-1,2-mannosidase
MRPRLLPLAIAASSLLMLLANPPEAGAAAHFTAGAIPPAASLAALVDTRTWTSGGGNTFPGADAPFGMIQWSPDTEPGRADGGGYTYGNAKLTGYSLTHLSGPGCPVGGDLPILPMTGPLPQGNRNNLTTTFTNKGEVAQAGYYQASSNAPNTITAQFTATTHAASAQFTFPKTKQADFLIKLDDSELLDLGSTAQVTGNDEITGSIFTGNFCGEDSQYGYETYTVYFDLLFNRPFTGAKTTANDVWVTFNTTANQVVQAHASLSYVSIANAQLDQRTELPAWNFAQYQTAAQARWNALLGEIAVSGGGDAKTQEFYSLLYKDLLHPNVVSDVNGQYMGSDLKVHTVAAPQANQYSMFSGWDIYHSLAQLQAMLDPAAASDMAQSLVNYYAENGILPQWGYLNTDNYTQVGDPADAIIADYYAFGARDFDTEAALADMLKQATTVNTVRPGEALEAKYGYLPEDGQYGCCRPHRYVSALLEYDTADFALSQYAAALGDTTAAAMLRTRADNWTNVFDRKTALLTPRLENGTFIPGIRPTTGSHYVEGDAEEYLWDVPNDYAGLFKLLGGARKVRPELSAYLSKPNGFGQYLFIENEFDLGEQYAPDYAGDPAETQWVVNDIRTKIYLPGPYGLGNNDDLGAESSQFIWECLGLYPENPGSDLLLLTSPAFKNIKLQLPDSTTITISAPGAAQGEFYVSGLTINGAPDAKLYTRFSTLAPGTTLTWALSRTPTTWATSPSDAPPSYPPAS